MKNILLVEDSKEIFQQVNAALSSIVNIQWAQDLQKARDFLETSKFEMILLDVELPDGNGVEFCSEIISTDPKASVFFLSAHGELPDKVIGFTAGAEDYITKPFQSLELKARVEAKLKKRSLLEEKESSYTWKELEVYPSRQEVFVKTGDDRTAIDLTSLEFKILGLMCEREGEVLSRDYLLNEIWGKDVHIYQRSVDTHVSKLRRKMGDAASVIESVHGVGYKFNPHPLTAR